MEKTKYVVYIDKDRSSEWGIRAVSRDLNFNLELERLEVEVEHPKYISQAVKEKLGITT